MESWVGLVGLPSQTAIRALICRLNYLHFPNPCMAYYSFTKPRGMVGWVGLVALLIADTLPTKWSHDIDQGEFTSQTDVLTTEPRRQPALPLDPLEALSRLPFVSIRFWSWRRAGLTNVGPRSEKICRPTHRMKMKGQTTMFCSVFVIQFRFLYKVLHTFNKFILRGFLYFYNFDLKKFFSTRVGLQKCACVGACSTKHVRTFLNRALSRRQPRIILFCPSIEYVVCCGCLMA